ncbi:MAG TPA: transcriptional regulator MntR [Planctomycetaceae bacterium]|nr:transcriptional regulator MntR [Planctomycetaceae bacterium]HRF00533.1 manganese-binding transcriptional regulator MntR [Pirellulaceae bacterium]
MTRRPARSSHSRTREDHSSELAEDYVEAIAGVIEAKGSCRVVDLAKEFQVSHVTVSRTVARLQREELVSTAPYGPIELTAKGQRLAKQSRRRHEIVLRFLKALGVSDETAAHDSEGIEHHVSRETLEAMERFAAGEESARRS